MVLPACSRFRLLPPGRTRSRLFLVLFNPLRKPAFLLVS
jgi:hypothetical protein